MLYFFFTESMVFTVMVEEEEGDNLYQKKEEGDNWRWDEIFFCLSGIMDLS